MRPFRKINSEQIQQMLETPATQGNAVVLASLELFKQGSPIRVVRHSSIKDNIAELHLHEDDLWYCLAGQASFILGGELVNPRTQDSLTYIADSVRGGTVVTMEPGDWLHIPAGQVHQPTTSTWADLIIIKIPASEGKVTVDYLTSAP